MSDANRLATAFVSAVAIFLISNATQNLAEDKKQEEWVFKPEKRTVVHKYDVNLFGVGYINEFGDFVPDKKVPPFDALAYEKYRHLKIYNSPEIPRDESVYEYRKGTLILGWMGAGYFEPKPGSKVIRFEDYKYDPTHPQCLRIYNLPGKFVKKSELKPEKKQEK
jgi:hypothetical protein